MPVNLRPDSISFSGHTLGWRHDYNGLEIYPPVPAEKDSIRRQTVEFSGRGTEVHLSSFSGALTQSTDEELVVVYYD